MCTWKMICRVSGVGVGWLGLGLLCVACASPGKREPVCGDGVVEADEECDDGPYNGQPGKCRVTCVAPFCGDGILDPGEQCDDGNGESFDGCSSGCLHEVLCGDGMVEGAEQCDDGNTDDGDGCDASCRWEYECGNGECEVERNETCPLCPEDCCPCGDGICAATDGETCAMCAVDCCPNCGDGVLQAEEQCDDGNLVDGDGCSAACEDEDGQAECGNGIWESGEECDDGNSEDGDGCSAGCMVEFVCGDGLCDAPNGETCQRCPQDCCPNCGNGVRDDGEECDGAQLGGLSCEALCFDGGTLGCTAWCAFDTSQCTGSGPSCGDGEAECGEACDGDDLLGQTCESVGYGSGSLACSASCALDVSGCGPLLYYFSEDFEGACPPGNWTLSGDWECGSPSSGPGAAYGGSACIATNLAGDYANYLDWDDSTADTPEIDLSAATDPVFLFYSWLDTEGSVFDGVNVKVSTDGGQTFVVLDDVTPAYTLTVGGQSAWGGDHSAEGWTEYTADLSAYVGQSIVLRFALRSDGLLSYEGWYIDEVTVCESMLIPVSVTTPSPLPDGLQDASYSTFLAATGGSGSYVWSLVAGGTNDDWLSIDPATGELYGTPDATAVGAVSVTVRVEDSALATNFAEKVFAFNVCGVEALPYFEDFEGGCPVSGWALGGDWECGTPSYGPAGAYDGSLCLGTDLDSSYENDRAWGESAARCPAIDLHGTVDPVLLFYLWMDTEGYDYDGVNLKVSIDGGQTFAVVDTVDVAYDQLLGGQSGWGGDWSAMGWRAIRADLASYAGHTIYLRWDLYSDLSSVYAGAYLDAILVAERNQMPIAITTETVLEPAFVDAFYSTSIEAEGGTGVYVWSIEGGNNHAWLSIDANTGELYGTPDATALGPVSVTVRAAEATLPSNYCEKTFVFNVVAPIYTVSFETCPPAGWTLSGDWECGTPSYGPTGVPDGSHCLGTDLDSTYESYRSWGDSVADSPPIVFSATGAPWALFYMWVDIECCNYDGANIKVSTDGGTTFAVVESVVPSYNATAGGQAAWDDDQSGSGWQPVTVDLSAYAGQTVVLRFSLYSDSLYIGPGIYVDDLTLFE